MALNIPTTQQTVSDAIANFESELGQTIPLTEQAFVRVLSVIHGFTFTTLYKYATERALQNLALTATGEDLDRIGINYGVIRTTAVSTQVQVTLSATTGTVIPINTDFIGDFNGLRYFTDSEVTAVSGVATLNITCEQPGVAGNLQVGDTLTLVSQISGAGNQASVSTLITTGADRETDDNYRPRVLAALRTTTGGGNSSSYKEWAEEVAGVFQVYPFTLRPGGGTLPGDRTVYVQAETSVDSDGIAPSSLLAQVRSAININPDTSLSRPPLGLPDSTLYVESISRTVFETTITGLVVDSGIETQVKADILSALTTYYSTIAPFVVGIDFEPDRNDTITNLTVSTVIQGVLSANNASCSQVQFNRQGFGFVSSYTLSPGELGKAGTVTYVT